MSQLDYAAGYRAGMSDYDPAEPMTPLLYTRLQQSAFHFWTEEGGRAAYNYYAFKDGYRAGRDAAVLEAGDEL